MTRLLLRADDMSSTESRIGHYIYEQKSTSRAAIAHHLRLSLPTVTQHLSALMEEGIIIKGDMCDSTGGRKAQAYSYNSAHRYAIGVDIWQASFEIVLMDLYGGIVSEATIPMPFENSAEYCQRLCETVVDYAQGNGIDSSRVLGVGLSLQGIISPDGESVIYGDAMNTVGLNRRAFAGFLPWPCRMLHNVDAGAFAESWYHADLRNAFYLFLCEHFGASLIIDGHPYIGDTAMGSTIEHMCLVPDGQACYCGKRGCVEAYCSEKALLSQANESREVFFEKLRGGAFREQALWEEYLKKLALVINNIQMVVHSQVIVGGTLANALLPEDLLRLEQNVQAVSSFRTYGRFISLGICGRRSCAKGAGLQFIIDYLNNGQRQES